MEEVSVGGALGFKSAGNRGRERAKESGGGSNWVESGRSGVGGGGGGCAMLLVWSLDNNLKHTLYRSRS